MKTISKMVHPNTFHKPVTSSVRIQRASSHGLTVTPPVCELNAHDVEASDTHRNRDISLCITVPATVSADQVKCWKLSNLIGDSKTARIHPVLNPIKRPHNSNRFAACVARNKTALDADGSPENIGKVILACSEEMENLIKFCDPMSDYRLGLTADELKAEMTSLAISCPAQETDFDSDDSEFLLVYKEHAPVKSDSDAWVLMVQVLEVEFEGDVPSLKPLQLVKAHGEPIVASIDPLHYVKLFAEDSASKMRPVCHNRQEFNP
jgi:hypothetical protein